MAFSKAGWNPIGGQSKAGTAPQMFMYTTTDSQTTVRAANYFNEVIDDLHVGDVIISVTSTAGTLASAIHTVNANDGTTVDVTNGQSISQTDSD